MKKGAWLFTLAVVFAFIFFLLVFGNGLPDLSPFFPDLGPFNASVTILDSNTAPLIINLSSEIYVCEGQSLNSFFNVTDLDEDPLTISISPTSIFFVSPSTTSGGQSVAAARIFSGILNKNSVGTHARIVSASDGLLADARSININVIEINNPPNLTRIGVQTVWTYGDDSVFYHQVKARDIEDGDQDFGNLTFNISFFNSPKLFNISTNGTMIFNPNATLNFSSINIPITYNISVCVRDTGIENPSVNISLCGQNGGPITRCNNFSLTVTDENRAPIIESHYPLNLSFDANGEQEIYFNISTRDPDWTIPDAYWYVDDNFALYNTSSFFYEFRHSFDCGVGGLHYIRADVTDGLLNGSIQWNATVEPSACPASSSAGGGGGGGGKKCNSAWGCESWSVCQSIEGTSALNLLSEKGVADIREKCRLDFFGERCGFHIRTCLDINSCNSVLLKPEGVEHCEFVANPSCSDGVNNCHNGDCELLVDCGGPCDACPTCSDEIKNQGEEGVDCGGSCPLLCPVRPPFWGRIRVMYVLMFLFPIFLILIIFYLIRIYKYKKSMEKIYSNANSV